MIRSHWSTILRVAGFKALNAVGFYTVFVYATTYLTSILHVRRGGSLAGAGAMQRHRYQHVTVACPPVGP